jgi:RimK-like ATP-grasp domain
MKFYCLHEDIYEGVQLRLDQLKDACERLNIEFVPLNNLTVDYSNLPKLGKTDLLYNSARGSQTLESFLLNENVTTFYCKNPPLNQTFTTTDWSIIHDKANLLSPKTIFNITADRQLLKNYLDYLGGFPIIIKATGSTRGIGTMKIDSWQNLISTVDYLMTTGDKFILRQFIKAKSGCRLIVLGNEVIAGGDFTMNENDFRNAVDLKQVKYFKREYSEAVNQAAIKATHLANTEFSGVDFLEDENGKFYLLEINFPTGFSGLIDVCGVDIPFKMIEYLINKSDKS